MVAVTVELKPQASSAMPKSVGAIAEPSSGPRSCVGGAEFLDPGVAGGVERGRGEDQDRGIDGQREA